MPQHMEFVCVCLWLYVCMCVCVGVCGSGGGGGGWASPLSTHGVTGGHWFYAIDDSIWFDFFCIHTICCNSDNILINRPVLSTPAFWYENWANISYYFGYSVQLMLYNRRIASLINFIVYPWVLFCKQYMAFTDMFVLASYNFWH